MLILWCLASHNSLYIKCSNCLLGVSNPVGRVQHPDWLYKRLAERNSTCRQRRIDDMFSLRAERPVTSPSGGAIESTAADIELLDIEDVAGGGGAKKPTMSVVTTRSGRQNDENSAPSSSAKRKHSEMAINISQKSHIRLLLLINLYNCNY